MRGMVGGEVFADGQNKEGCVAEGFDGGLVGSVPACPTVSPHEGASISSRCALSAMHKHFYTWKRFLCGWGICSLQMETSPLRMGTCFLRMETSLRGRSGGHTGTAPIISRMVRIIRLPENSLPRHKHKCIVVANSLPHYKHKCIVAANSLPRHKYKCIVVANSSPRHKHKCIVVANSSPHHRHKYIVVANSLPRHKHK